MELKKGIIRPGRVVGVYGGGIIRAIAPGLFAPTDDVDTLPPIHPFFNGSTGSFSTLEIYDEVWILNFTDNPEELFYIRKDSFNDSNFAVPQSGLECFLLKQGGVGQVALYYNEEQGWVMQNGETLINLNPKGEILLKTPFSHRTIHINATNISLGSEGSSAQPAILGYEMQILISYISKGFDLIAEAAAMNPYTRPIAQAVKVIKPVIDAQKDHILSYNVTLD